MVRNPGWRRAVARDFHHHFGAAAGRAADAELASEQHGALLHAQQAERALVGGLLRCDAAAVVPHL